MEEKIVTACNGDEICKHLEERIGGAQFEVSKGIASLFIINKETGKTSLWAVVYKANKKDKGLAFNYCPFCGGKPGNFQRV